MAVITTLQTRAERLQADQAAELRQLVLDVPGLPEMAVGKIVAAIDRQTHSGSDWTFVMINAEQHAAVVGWLLDHSKSPLKAVRLWSICFTDLRKDTGEIMLRREELADLTGVEPGDVSRIMTDLVGINAIIRRREKVPGMKGTGIAKYFINPLVGNCLAGAERDRAQAGAPALKVVFGGKP